VLPDQENQVEQAIAEDVGRIINTAVNFGVDEITAHTVIDALSASWQDLATAQFEMWDGH
jgi:hypothetical protein